MLFAILCTDKAGHLPLRLENRAAHLAYLAGYGEQVVAAGPTFADDGTTMNGSLLILDLEDRAAVATFLAGDPYGQAGLFETVQIRPWKRVLPAA